MFKSVFVNQENILAKMIADITGIDYSLLKDNVILETNELPIDSKNEKAKKCDFIIRLDKDNIINLELNRRSHAGMVVKNLSYLFKLFSLSTKSGDEYNDNLIVTQININCFKPNNYNKIKPLSVFQIMDKETKEVYSKNLIIYDLNVVKCHELYYNLDEEDEIPNYIRWGALIYCNDFNDIPNITSKIMTPKERKIFMDGLSKLTHEDLFYSEEEALEWAEWERKTIETEIKKKAREEGLNEGREKGIEIGKAEGFSKGLSKGRKEGRKEGFEQGIDLTIKKMLERNIPIEEISIISGKSIEEINKFKEKQ